MDWMDAGFAAGRGLTSGILGAINGGQADNGSAPTAMQRVSAASRSAQEGYDKFMEEQDQITNAGKAADYARKAMGPDAESQTGITDAEWQNMGNGAKAAALQNFGKQQALAEIMARTKAINQNTATSANDQAAGQKFSAQYLLATTPQLQPGAVPGGSPLTTQLLGSRPAPIPQPNQQDIAQMALASGMRPEAALRMAASPVDASNPLVFDRNSLPGMTVVKTQRGGGFQVVPNERPDRTQMTDYQKAQLVNAARDKYLAAKRQVDSFNAMPDDKFAQSLLPGAQQALQSAQDELAGYGINPNGKANPAAGGGGVITTKAQFDALPSGTVYTGKDGKQYRKP